MNWTNLSIHHLSFLWWSEFQMVEQDLSLRWPSWGGVTSHGSMLWPLLRRSIYGGESAANGTHCGGSFQLSCTFFVCLEWFHIDSSLDVLTLLSVHTNRLWDSYNKEFLLISILLYVIELSHCVDIVLPIVFIAHIGFSLFFCSSTALYLKSCMYFFPHRGQSCKIKIIIDLL